MPQVDDTLRVAVGLQAPPEFHTCSYRVVDAFAPLARTLGEAVREEELERCWRVGERGRGCGVSRGVLGSCVAREVVGGAASEGGEGKGGGGGGGRLGQGDGRWGRRGRGVMDG